MKRIAAIALLTVTGAAHALTGNQLLGMMQDKDQFGQTMGVAYVRGFIDASSYQRLITTTRNGKAVDGRFFCMPDEATVEQARDIVKAALESDPSSRHLDAGALALVALTKAWPCK